MKKHFVRTKNLTHLEGGIRMLSERGAREASWMVVTGRPGEGKTTTLHHWGSMVDAVFLTATESWRPNAMVNALATELKVVLGRYAEHGIGEALCSTSEGKVIVIDEAQFCLARGAACLERLRGITDKSGTPVVLIMMSDDVPKLGRREQISSRIFTWVQFTPSSVEDVAAACAQLAEVKIAPDLVQRIHSETAGRMRDVINAISRVEMAAKGIEKERVNAEDMRRVVLRHDYRKGFSPSLRAKVGA